MKTKQILVVVAPLLMTLTLAASDARGEAGPFTPPDIDGGVAASGAPSPEPAAQPAAEPTAQPAAQPAAPPAADPVAVKPAEPPTPPAAAGKEPPKAYSSPMRAQCEEELRKDAGWYAALGKQVRAGVHAQDARLMTTNYRHVVLAYAAIWVLTVGFVVFVWLRQSNLRAEILRLQRDLERAVGDDGKDRDAGKDKDKGK